MAHRWLTILFTVGKFLTITPSYNSKVSRSQTICTFVLVTLEILLMIFSVVTRQVRYPQIYSKVVVSVLNDLYLLIFSCCISLTVVLWKKAQWQKLITNLKIIASNANNTKKIVQHVKISLARLVTDLTILIVEYGFWSTIFDLSNFIKISNAHYVDYYLVFSFNTFLSLILIVVLTQYRYLNQVLEEQIGSEIIYLDKLASLLREIERNLLFLKETVDLINDIFGWPLALLISYTTLYIVNNFDYIFQDYLIPDNKIAFKILADTTLVLLTFVSTIFRNYLLSLKWFL
jgi:hypothetical protein